MTGIARTFCRLGALPRIFLPIAVNGGPIFVIYALRRFRPAPSLSKIWTVMKG